MCDAKRIGDQMMCGRCGIQWDHDDPDGDSCCPMNRPSVARPDRGCQPGLTGFELPPLSVDSVPKGEIS